MGTTDAHSLLMALSEGMAPFQVFLENFGLFITHPDMYSLILKLSYSFFVGVLGFFFLEGVLLISRIFNVFSSWSL